MTIGAFLAGHTGRLLAMAALLALSGFFSGSETALFKLTRGQLHRLRRSSGPGKVAASLMSRPQRTLNTLLLGNILVNVAYAGISAVMVLDLSLLNLRPWQMALVSLIPLLVLILLGEVTPKVLAYALEERWAVPAAGILLIIGKVLSGPIRLLERVIVAPMVRIIAPDTAGKPDITSDELASVLDLTTARGLIGPNTNALLQEIIELTDLRVRDIMVPRVDMVAYDAAAPREGLLELFRRTGLRRIPIYEGDVDHTLGLIHAKRLLLQGDAPLRDLVVAVGFVPETGNVEQLLLQFRVKRTQTAIVVDEYGGTAGLVTLEDVLEEIVGDIGDPSEAAQAPAVQPLGGNSYLLDANLAIHEWADAFKIDLSGKRISTVGGFVTSLLGRIARRGDSVTYRNLSFTVESMRRSRIDKLRLDLLTADSAAAAKGKTP